MRLRRLLEGHRGYHGILHSCGLRNGVTVTS